MRQENVDIIGLQEMIKENFLLHEHEGLSRHKFAWHWVPASGHSGGILLGVKEDTFEVDDMDHGEFFVSMALTHRRSNLRWEVIIVYGPADYRRSLAFLAELTSKVERCTTPVMVAGDFNLIRSPEDKSSAHVDLPRMRMFNDCIADLALREITRAGARYTWSNNWIDPIQSVLDRVFVSMEWEMAFPLCSLCAVTRIGSDHSPLLLSSGGGAPPRLNRFHFENFWLGQEGFVEVVCIKWEAVASSPPAYIMQLTSGITVLRWLASSCKVRELTSGRSFGRRKVYSLWRSRISTVGRILWVYPPRSGFSDMPLKTPL
jgi:exonuclease III